MSKNRHTGAFPWFQWQRLETPPPRPASCLGCAPCVQTHLCAGDARLPGGEGSRNHELARCLPWRPLLAELTAGKSPLNPRAC